mgnify:CR=1 FL=1
MRSFVSATSTCGIDLDMDIERQDIRNEVERVLREASHGKGKEPWFLTAYQILARLPVEMQVWMIETYGQPGKGGGQHNSAALQVARIASSIVGDDNKAYLDTGNLLFDVPAAGDPLRAGYELCAIFRLPSGG